MPTKGKGPVGSKSGQRNIKSRKVVGGTKTRATNSTGDTKYVQTTRQLGRLKVVRNKRVSDAGRKTKTTMKRTAPKRRR
jgi:hypothetical protein